MPSIQLMLAGKAGPVDTLQYPLLASPKLDGIRATVIDGVVYSRNMKPIPNTHVQRLFGTRALNGVDGELLVGSPTAEDAFRVTTSVVMADAQTFDNLFFHAFDMIPHASKAAMPFHDRQHVLVCAIMGIKRPSVRHAMHVVSQTLVKSMGELLEYEETVVGMGYEGVMLRSLDGTYKHGRSTTREGALLKLKRFEDSEAVIRGIEELEHNANRAELDALGRTKRTSHKAGKVGMGKLGALVVRDCKTGVDFNIGTGFKDEEREELWKQGISKLHGKIVKYRYFPTGSKTKPRFPVFVGFRDRRDM